MTIFDEVQPIINYSIIKPPCQATHIHSTSSLRGVSRWRGNPEPRTWIPAFAGM